MDDWEKQHNELMAKYIVDLGPTLCDEYSRRDFNGRNSHSPTATELSHILGTGSWVGDVFRQSMYKARELISNGGLNQQLKNDLEKTLTGYYAADKK